MITVFISGSLRRRKSGPPKGPRRRIGVVARLTARLVRRGSHLPPRANRNLTVEARPLCGDRTDPPRWSHRVDLLAHRESMRLGHDDRQAATVAVDGVPGTPGALPAPSGISPQLLAGS